MTIYMDEKEKEKMRKLGITERGITIMEECEKFCEEQHTFMENGVATDENIKKIEEATKKLEWYRKEIDIEMKKSLEPLEREKKRISEAFLHNKKRMAM